MKTEIEIQLNIFIDILTHLIDKNHSEKLETIEEQNDNGKLVEYILNKYSKLERLPNTIECISIEDLDNFYSNKHITVNEIKNRGIENNGLLYAIKVASDELQSVVCEHKYNF